MTLLLQGIRRPEGRRFHLLVVIGIAFLERIRRS